MEDKRNEESEVGEREVEGRSHLDVWTMSHPVQGRIQNQRMASSELMGDEIDQTTTSNIANPCLPIEVVLSGKQKEGFHRGLQSRIIKRYTKLTRSNPQITKFLSNIVKDIKNNLLTASKPSPIATTPLPIQTLSPRQELPEPTVAPITGKIVADSAVMKQSCFRSLLVQNHGDNDVASDEEDLNAGIRYMYGELLYSVGNEMVNQRKQSQSQVKTKDRDGNKENQDMNNRQPISNSKAHTAKQVNANPKTNTKMQPSQTSQIKSKSNAQPFHSMKPQILRL